MRKKKLTPFYQRILVSSAQDNVFGCFLVGMGTSRAVLGVLVCIIMPVVLNSGCQYRMDSLYRSDIDTIYVKMFESKSFHRQVEFDLTRAFCEQLELHSPYKIIADQSKADTILYGTINEISEHVLSAQRDLDRPLENEMTMSVNVTWKDLRNGEQLLNKKRLLVSGDYLPLLASGRKSSIQQMANEMAVQIVEAMEKPW